MHKWSPVANNIFSMCNDIHRLLVLKPAASYRFVDVSLKDSIACHCAVRAVRFCPYTGNEDLILSVGYDSDITVDDIAQPSW